MDKKELDRLWNEELKVIRLLLSKPQTLEELKKNIALTAEELNEYIDALKDQRWIVKKESTQQYSLSPFYYVEAHSTPLVKEVLSALGKEKAFTELKNNTGLSDSDLNWCLEGLLRLGIVEKNPKTGSYRISTFDPFNTETWPEPVKKMNEGKFYMVFPRYQTIVVGQK